MAAVRAITGQRKSGHSGTLDPLAAGVLPLCLGRATKLFDYIMEKDKEYLAELTLGVETDTQDADGAVLYPGRSVRHRRCGGGSGASTIPRQDHCSSRRCIRRSCMRARKLYKIARSGETVERKHREIDMSWPGNRGAHRPRRAGL